MHLLDNYVNMQLIYVNMQDNLCRHALQDIYFDMQAIYVNMQLIYVNMQDEYVNMQDEYVNMQIIIWHVHLNAFYVDISISVACWHI